VWAYSNRSLSKCNERWCNKPNLFVLVHIKPIGLYQIEPVGVGCVHVLYCPLLGKVLIGVSQIEKGAVLSGPLLGKVLNM
jgi:hypothetical protein